MCVSSADAQAADELSDAEREALWMEMVEEYGWERSGRGKLDSQADIAIPEGFRFTGKRGTEKLMKYLFL